MSHDGDLLRRFIRQILILEYGEATGASGSDPTDPKGFYPYEIKRGNDIQGYWYRSPGRSVGGDGDPGRPSDAKGYIGMNAADVEGESGEGGGETAAAKGGEKAPEKLFERSHYDLVIGNATFQDVL